MKLRDETEDEPLLEESGNRRTTRVTERVEACGKISPEGVEIVHGDVRLPVEECFVNVLQVEKRENTLLSGGAREVDVKNVAKVWPADLSRTGLKALLDQLSHTLFELYLVGNDDERFGGITLQSDWYFGLMGGGVESIDVDHEFHREVFHCTSRNSLDREFGIESISSEDAVGRD